MHLDVVDARTRGSLSPIAASRLFRPFHFRDRRVKVVKDIAYVEGGGSRQKLDVYLPEAGASQAPVLLQVHGGAWVIGNKAQQAQPLLHHMAASGWVCVSINYRLSPRSRFPAHIEDVKHAMHWVKQHVAEYGGDPGFVAVTGGSAGGHLAALAAVTANAAHFQQGIEGTDTRLQACVPFYGVYDFAPDGQSHPLGGDFVDFLGRTVMPATLEQDREAYERASPLRQVGEHLPPFLVIHGTHDSLAPVEGAREFVAALERHAKQPVVYLELPMTQHAFEIFHSLRTRHVVAAVQRFLVHVHAAHLERVSERPETVGRELSA